MAKCQLTVQTYMLIKKATIHSSIQMVAMKKISEKGFKVSVSGTGADEIFTGYYDHHLFYLSEQNCRLF